jgi:hypothetical protein
VNDQTTPEQMIALLRGRLPAGCPAVRVHAQREVNEQLAGNYARFGLCLFEGDRTDKVFAAAWGAETAGAAIDALLTTLAAKLEVPECGGACCSCGDPHRCMCPPCDRCKAPMTRAARTESAAEEKP